MASSPTHTNLGSLIEKPESGRMKITENGVVRTRIYGGTRALCEASAPVYKSLGTGAESGYYVQEAEVVPRKGEQADLIITWRAGGEDADPGDQPLPVDRVSLNSQDLNPATEKNKAFPNVTASTTLYKAGGSTGTAADGAKTLIGWVRLAGLATGQESDEAWEALKGFVTTPGGAAFDEALVLADFLRRGVQNYYQASFEYAWTEHSYSEPVVSAGGFIETPGGPLGSLVDALGLSCLRLADGLDFSDGVYAVTHRWLCGPDGHWDSILYTL